LSKTEQRNDRKPWYVIDRGNRCLNLFHVFPSLVGIFTCTNYLIFIAFGIFNDWLWDITRMLEGLFIVEIILNFLTSYIDPESLDDITDIKEIMRNYVFRGDFLMHLIAVFPYYTLIGRTDMSNTDLFYQDTDQVLRDLLLLKLIRLYRIISFDFISHRAVLKVLTACYSPNLRDDKISMENALRSVIIVMNNSILVIMFSFIVGLLWYRASDYLFPHWFSFEPSDAYFV